MLILEVRMVFAPLKKIAFLSSYVPRRCGIASFTHDLYSAIAEASPKSQCFVCALTDSEGPYHYPSDVTMQIVEHKEKDYLNAAEEMNHRKTDVLCIQHEFGIYGGDEGRYILTLLENVHCPVVTTFHTLLQRPNKTQMMVMKSLIHRSSRLVVMAKKGAQMLQDIYQVDPEKIDIIPHGIRNIPFSDSASFKPRFGLENKRVLLTFGLLSPGKGLEYVIQALPDILRTYPNTVYMIVGATHPQLLAHKGEHYRETLKALATELGVSDHVLFYNNFVSADELAGFIEATDIYITPYLNEEQITSGTLSYVFGSGKAVISTPYWHAQELLGDGKGILVPFRDASAIVEAVNTYWGDGFPIQHMLTQAYALGRKMIWPAVASLYLTSFKKASAQKKEVLPSGFQVSALNLDHIKRLTDSTGIFQHATFSVPHMDFGYCTDDNARAYLLCLKLQRLKESDPDINILDGRYLTFISASFDYQKCRFRNFMSGDKKWMEEVGSEDSQGRALWALGAGAGLSFNEGHSRQCKDLFLQGLPSVSSFTSPRAWALAILGIYYYRQKFDRDEPVEETLMILTQKLAECWARTCSKDWPWFESYFTYDNARLSQACLLSSSITQNTYIRDIGLTSLEFLVTLQTSKEGCFSPIGNQGFYKKGGKKAQFDQQPLEAQGMIEACIDAYHLTKNSKWLIEAHRAFNWFFGHNDGGRILYNFNDGGCKDGLLKDAVNENQGAESTLAFHLSRASIATVQPILNHLLRK
jgi:glycosyltransferase involved in cell wall biosynthesis